MAGGPIYLAAFQPQFFLPSLPRLGNVCSISYAWYELDQCDISPGVAPCENQPVPAGSAIFVNAVNQLFAKAAARGVTLVAASGDSGAHGRTDPTCSSPTTRAGACLDRGDIITLEYRTLPHDKLASISTTSPFLPLQTSPLPPRT